MNVAAALSALSPQQRLAVEYHYRWGWPYWAVAAAIGASEATARVHAMRGLKTLCNLLASRDDAVR